jgi:hypothetical protein
MSFNIRTLTSEELSHRFCECGYARAKAEREFFLLDEHRKILLDKLTLKIADEKDISHNKALSYARTSKEFEAHIDGQAIAKEELYQKRADYSECDFEIKRRLNASFSKNKEWNSGRIVT